jgi:hypothetical protein
MDAVVYATERHGESFGYDIPLAEPGTYTLILKFVEVRIQSLLLLSLALFQSARRESF